MNPYAIVLVILCNALCISCSFSHFPQIMCIQNEMSIASNGKHLFPESRMSTQQLNTFLWYLFPWCISLTIILLFMIMLMLCNHTIELIICCVCAFHQIKRKENLHDACTGKFGMDVVKRVHYVLPIISPFRSPHVHWYLSYSTPRLKNTCIYM